MEVTKVLLTMDDLPGQCGRPIVQTIWDVTCRNIHTPAGCDIWIPKYGPDPHIHGSGPMRIPEVPGNPMNRYYVPYADQRFTLRAKHVRNGEDPKFYMYAPRLNQVV